MKWEYKETVVLGPSAVPNANEEGQQGWELCAMAPRPDGNSYLLVYKRQIPQHP